MATAGGAGGDCGGSAGVGDDGPPVGDICGSSNPSWPSDTSSPSQSPQHCLEYAAARSWARAVKENPTKSHWIALSFAAFSEFPLPSSCRSILGLGLGFLALLIGALLIVVNRVAS